VVSQDNPGGQATGRTTGAIDPGVPKAGGAGAAGLPVVGVP
jgi:hypothetical protein